MNRIKEGIIILECIALMLICCACGKVKDPIEPTGRTSGTADLDLSYESETDCQIGIGQLPVRAYTSNGIYFIEDGENLEAKYLKFYDSAAERIVYVCSKSNCSHNDEECMAYLDSQEYPMPNIWYYDGSLYISKVDSDYMSIGKIALDGSTRADSCTLMRIIKETVKDPTGDIEYTYYPEMTLHRGYVYFSTFYPGCESADFRRVKLNSEEESEILYSLEGTALMLGRMKPYGGYVFFQAGTEDAQNIAIDIYKYDIETNETEEYYPGVIRDYVPTEGGLYYLDLTNSIHKTDSVTKEDTVFYEPANSVGIVSLFIKGDKLIWQKQDADVVDDRGIYVYEQTVLDMNGNIIQELNGTQDDWYNSSGNLLAPY
ncbi:MAG: hypothetical protein K2K54_08030 [Lachnospiraceae bacterium]|nr:hypothetical protein [Lachnospiraceae bacterium]